MEGRAGIPVDDVTNSTESSKHHECDIDTEVLELVPHSIGRQCLVNKLRELDTIVTWDEVDNGCIPECRSGRVQCRDEVNDDDEEDTFDRSGKG